MTFGRTQPQDHLPPKKTLAELTQDLDLRRQAQIANQIDSINRLLKDGSYDDEMAALHAELAKKVAAINRARVKIDNTKKVSYPQRGHLYDILKALEDQDD